MNQEKEPQKGSQKKQEETNALAEKQAESEKGPEAAEPEKKAESCADEKAAKKGNKKEKPSFFKSQKFKHGGAAAAFTAGFLAIIILVNVIVGILSDKYPSINLDVTKAGTNTLSAETAKTVDSDKLETTITICATKQACQSNSVTSDGADYSQVDRLISKAAERNHNITVKYVDLDKDPVFAKNYQSDNITAGDVIVETKKRHRVLAESDLFTSQASSNYGSQTYYSNVGSALASAINAVTADTMPIAAFDTGHSEKMESTGYERLLQNNSFETKDINLLTDKIPDGTQLFVLGCPTTDYTDGEISKIDAFLHSKTASGDRSVIIVCSPGQPTLAKLSAYMEEWGLGVQTDNVVEETSYQKFFNNNPLYILADVQDSINFGNSHSGYNNFTAPYSCPVNIKARNVGSKMTYSLIKSSDSSAIYRSSKKESDTQTAAQNIAALSQESVQANNKPCHANLIVTGSSLMFGSNFVNTSAFSNAAYDVDLSKYATGTNNNSTQVTTSNHQLYAADITINTNVAKVLGYGVFTVLIPLAVAVAGIIVYRKRRAL
jgi:hypothetical protein